LKVVKRIRNSKTKAFSSIELAVSIIIIFLLIFIAAYNYWNALEYSKVATFIQTAKFIKIASDRYFIDKGFYPSSILELFTDPYKDYLPRQIASNFLYSPWNSEISIHTLNSQNYSILFLYLEYRKEKKILVSKTAYQYLKEELYFYKINNYEDRGVMVFLLSKIYR